MTDCTILDARHVGLRLEDVSDSRVSDCLIRSDLSDPAREGPAGESVPLEVVGGSGNMIVDNLLDSRPRIDDGAGHVQGNVHP